MTEITLTLHREGELAKCAVCGAPSIAFPRRDFTDRRRRTCMDPKCPHYRGALTWDKWNARQLGTQIPDPRGGTMDAAVHWQSFQPVISKDVYVFFSREVTVIPAQGYGPMVRVMGRLPVCKACRGSGKVYVNSLVFAERKSCHSCDGRGWAFPEDKWHWTQWSLKGDFTLRGEQRIYEQRYHDNHITYFNWMKAQLFTSSPPFTDDYSDEGS